MANRAEAEIGKWSSFAAPLALLPAALLAGAQDAPPEDLRTDLLVHYPPAQIVELGAGIALFMGFSKIAVSLGGLPESIPVHEQPTPDWP